MKEKKNLKWLSWFTFAVAVIFVYKTLDNFNDISMWIKNLISILIKKNAPLSKKHIVLAFNAYERSVNYWQIKEQKHISAIAVIVMKKKLI